MSKHVYMWPLRVPQGKYYKRHYSRTMYDGTPTKILCTRFTCGKGLVPESGPRGGTGYRPFLRDVFYKDGIFYRSLNVALEQEGKYGDRLFPITGTIWTKDFWEESSLANGVPLVSIHCEAGVPIFGTLRFDRFEEPVEWNSLDEPWAMIEPWLDLVCKQRKSPTRKKG